MIIEELIPCLSLFGIGLLVFNILSGTRFNLSLSEKIVYVIVLFSAILIIPWSFFGLQKMKIFFQLWPISIALIGLTYLGFIVYKHFKLVIMHLERVNKIYFSIKVKLNQSGINRTLIISCIIISFVLCFYTLLNLILTFRDFDAIWMYIPDALWYYRINYIPSINPLNFRVSTKEPFVSLLFSYSLYTSGALTIKLLPILFVIGWMLTIYVFCMKIWPDRSKAFLGMVLFLLSPFMYYIFTFWVYYQEIYVSFFYAVTILAIFNILKLEKANGTNISQLKLFYLFIGSLSFALSLLSKLSGWSLLFVILVLYPFPKRNRIIQSIFFMMVTLFLIIKVSVTFYIGIAIFLAFYCFLILFLHWKTPDKSENSIYNPQKFNSYGILIIPLGLGLGGFWLYDTLQKFGQYNSSFQDLYITIKSLNIKTIFDGTPLNSPHFLLESAHSTNFIAIVLYLLVGNMFVLFWIGPKLRVLFDDQVKFFVLWVLGFFMLWITYHGFTSVRYLSVILVPVIIIVTHGFQRLYQDITKKKRISSSLIIIASFLAFTSYYYPISPSILFKLDPTTLNQEFLLSAYNYYSNSIFYIFFALFTSLTVFWIFKLFKGKQISIPKLKFIPKGYIQGLALVIIVVVPFLVPSIVFISVNGNIDNFNSTYNYYQRPAYKEVVSAILDDNSPTSGIIAIDMPGLPIYLNQPEIDLYAQSSDFFPIFESNITNLLQLLQNPISFAKTNYNITIGSDISSDIFSFDYIIVPNYQNNVYKFYSSSLYEKSYLFSLLFQKNLFYRLYENSEFLVFKRIYNTPTFTGIVNTYIGSSSERSSILGQVQNTRTYQKNAEITFLNYFPVSNSTNLTVNTTITGTQENNIFSLTKTSNISLTNQNMTFSFSMPIFNILPKIDSFSINNITLKMVFKTNFSINVKNFILRTESNSLQVNYNPTTKAWQIETGFGLQPVS